MTQPPNRPSPHELRERNDRFRAQAEAFRLAFRCPDCVHIKLASMKCSLGYPNEHLLHSENAVEDDGEFMFCKYFEFGG